MNLRPLWRPAGPLPVSTYWWRRAFVVLGIAAVALVAALVARGGGGSNGAPAVMRGSSAPGPSRPPSQTASGTATTTSPPAAAEPSLCRDQDLAVTATSDADSYPTGVQPRLGLAVRNTSKHPCRRDLGAAARGYAVYSGSDRIWSTDDCNAGATSSVVTLQPGQEVSFHHYWDRHRSRPGCPSGEPSALAGTYRVYVHLGSLASSAKVFVLR